MNTFKTTNYLFLVLSHLNLKSFLMKVLKLGLCYKDRKTNVSM